MFAGWNAKATRDAHLIRVDFGTFVQQIRYGPTRVEYDHVLPEEAQVHEVGIFANE